MSERKALTGLEALERSDADFSELVEHAETTLGIDLRHTSDVAETFTGSKSTANTSTFKEQWVLRWLIRRFLAANGANSGAAHMVVLDSRPWALLLHLIYAIPAALVLEIFLERKFLPRLVAALQEYLDAPTQPIESQPDISEDDRARKRRRLSPENHPRIATKQTTDVLLSICARCSQLEAPADGVGHEAFTTLWSTVEDRARFLSIGLRLVLRVLSDGHEPELAFSSIPVLAEAWNIRPSATTAGLNTADIAAFNTICLVPCLELLQAIDTNHGHVAGLTTEPKRAVEVLVAKNTILPLREVFLKKHLKKWRVQKQCLMWEDIEPFVHDVGAHLNRSGHPSIFDNTDTLYEIALALIPKYDIRRKQQEQEWVDALLLALSYVTCPRLTRLALQQEGEIDIIDNLDELETLDNFSTFSSLLKVAATAHCSASTHVTSYLAAAVVSWPDFRSPWAAIAAIMRINAEAFNSHTRLPTSNFAQTQLIVRIDHDTTTLHDYMLLRDDIIIPTLQAFAASRMLVDFVTLWRPQLQEAMRVGLPQDGDEISTVHVWQDDDLLDELRKQAALSTSSLLLQKLLEELQEGLSGLTTRVGSTLDIFALVAIVTALLGSRGGLTDGRQHEILSAIPSLVSSALQRRSDYQGQRWRLWALLDSLQDSTANVAFPENLVGDKIMQTSLAEVDEETRKTPQWNQECFEQFRVLVGAFKDGHTALQDAFKQELQHLEASVARILESTNKSGLEEGWSGRSNTIRTPEQLAFACLGTLLANTTTLVAQPDLGQSLLKMMSTRNTQTHGDRATSSAFVQLIQSTARGAADKSERSLSQSLGVSQHNKARSIKDLEGMVLTNALRDSMSRVRPVYLRAAAENCFEDIKSANPKSMTVRTYAENLAFLEWVSRRISVSYTRPEQGVHWQSIAEKLNSFAIEDNVFDYLAASTMLNQIIEHMWTSGKSGEIKQGANDELTDMTQEALKTITSSKPPNNKFRLASDLFATNILRLLCSQPRGSNDLLRKMDLDSATGLLASLILHDLRGFLSVAITQGSVASILITLETAIESAADLPQKEEMRPLLADVRQLVSKASMADASDDGILAKLCHFLVYLCTSLEAGMAKNLPPAPAVGTGSVMDHGFTRESSTGDLSSADYVDLASQAVTLVDGLGQSQRVRHLFSASKNISDGVLEQFVTSVILSRLALAQFEEDESLRRALNTIACLSTATNTLSTELLLRLDNANLAMVLHPQSISQASIDALLARAYNLLSVGIDAGSNITLHPSHVVDRVCTIIGTLLSRFRRRLADRHHLLLPLLQQMLRFFFYSPAVQRRARQASITGSDPESLLRTLPNWLKTSGSIMPPSTATEFSRLLSSICNPTVSAAKSSRKGGKGSALNDETKRVKALAGQHMQYLVMEYCRCTLDGDIAAGVKEKLMPGVYTILDAMNRDLMRSMNADMDPSSRAIFKNLYDDWVRYGKWDKS